MESGLMKVEQYMRKSVPDSGNRGIQYRTEPLDLSRGLAIRAEAGEKLEEGGKKGLVKTGSGIHDMFAKIEETNRKVQREKDELFLDGVFHQAGAEFSSFEPTLDSDADGKRLELIRQKYSKSIENEKSISDESRTRALRLLENRFGEAGIRIGAARSRMVAIQNNRQKMEFLKENVANGNTAEALVWRDKLEIAGVAVPSADSIRSVCTLNGLVNELENAEIQTLRLDREKIKTCFDKKEGFLGMNSEHTRTYSRKLEEALRVKQADADQAWLAGFQNGDNIQTEDSLRAEHDYGLLDDKTYNKRLGIIRSYNQSIERAKRYSETQAEKAREKAEKEKINSFLSDLRLCEIPDDEIERKEFFNRKKEEAIKLSRDHSFLNQTWSICGDRMKEDSGYKNSIQYHLGMNILEKMKNEFTSYAEAADWNWYTLGIRHAPKAGKEVTKSNYEVMKNKLSLWLKNNPRATEAEIRSYLDETKKFINEQAVADLAAAWDKIPVGKVGFPKKESPSKESPPKIGERRRTRDGRIAEYDGKGWRAVNGY